MFKYKVNLGSELINPDNIITVLKGDGCTALGEGLRKEMLYEFGEAEYKFKVCQPSAE